MLNKIMKKGVLVLTFALIAIIIAQVTVMFFPYFEVQPIASRRDEVTELTKFSLQEYVWTDTETITNVFVERDKDWFYNTTNAIVTKGQVEENLEWLNEHYDEKAMEKIESGKKITKKNAEKAVMVDVNDDLVDLALVDAFALIALIMIAMELKHFFSKYQLPSRKAWIVLSHVLVIVWGIFTFLAFNQNCPVLSDEAVINPMIRTLCIVFSCVGLGVEALRLALAFITRTRYKKVQAVY